MGPEFEKGDGRLRPSLQQRLPGAEGPPEGCSTAPRHAACGGPIPARGATSYSFLFSAGTGLYVKAMAPRSDDHPSGPLARIAREAVCSWRRGSDRGDSEALIGGAAACSLLLAFLWQIDAVRASVRHET